MRSTIVWFRRDLRISDHAPLHRVVTRLSVSPIVMFGCALHSSINVIPAGGVYTGVSRSRRFQAIAVDG